MGLTLGMKFENWTPPDKLEKRRRKGLIMEQNSTLIRIFS